MQKADISMVSALKLCTAPLPYISHLMAMAGISTGKTEPQSVQKFQPQATFAPVPVSTDQR